MSNENFPKMRISRWLTLLTLTGLILGIVAGLADDEVSAIPPLKLVMEMIEGVGFIWVNLLQLMTIPMIVFLVWFALTRDFNGNMGKMGFLTFSLIIVGLLTSIGFLLAFIEPVLSLVPRPAPERITELKDKMIFETSDPGTPEWNHVLRVIFNNPVFVFIKQKLWIWLALPVFAVLITRLTHLNRWITREVIGSILNKTFMVVGWLINLAPVAVMGLTFAFARTLGYSITGIVLYLILTACLIIILFIILQLIILITLGRLHFMQLFKSLRNPYLVAMSSRSSLASLPVLIEEADQHLKLNRQICGFAYPVSAAFFKITNPLSSGFKLFFIAHIFYIPLSLSVIIVFMATLLLLSFTSRGIPSEGTGFRIVPLYTAAGVPVEGYFLVKSLYTIPDIFETISNLTGYLLIATLLHRFIGSRALEDPELSNLHLKTL